MPGAGRVAIGSIAGAIIAVFLAPFGMRFFSVPDGGVGFVTVHGYPKGWDYAVVALIIAFSFLGGLVAARPLIRLRHLLPWQGRRTSKGESHANRTHRPPSPPLAAEKVPKADEGAIPIEGKPHFEESGVTRANQWMLAAAVFLSMVFVHDHPYAFVDMFHDGEHLTPGFQLKSGQRPYADIFLLHGLATDGGLDALVLGDPPSPGRVRRMYTLLNAAALALLVPIAAEVCATGGGVALAALLSICALGAGQVKVFPYFRLLPVLLAVWALLRFARTARAAPLFMAIAASSLGLLWSVDTGTYALAATAVLLILGIRRRPRPAELAAVGFGLLLPLLLLLALGADVQRFFVDSFVIVPSSIDAIWSLPAPALWPMKFEGARYYVPLVFYGFLLALALRMPPARRRHMVILAIFSILLFRTAAGRVSWSHTRFAMPLLGIAGVAYVLEPLFRRRAWLAGAAVTLPFLFLLEVGPNLRDGARLAAGWRQRQKHEGLVPYPFRTGKGIYTYPQDADDLAALNGFLDSSGPGATFFDFSGERALHYFLERRPPVRVPDIHMLSSPPLLAEAMAQLTSRPPSFVVVEGAAVLSQFDGVPNAVRVPDLARWIDANYPHRRKIGRFTVATREP